MKAKKRLVVSHFLKVLQLRMQREEPVKGITTALGRILDKEDLREIVKGIFNKKVPDKDTDEMDPAELLNAIPSDIYILNYLLRVMSEDLDEALQPTSKGVFATLGQLGLQTHYLAGKPVEDWDGYDRSNYRALCLKAGNLIPFYGIYNTCVSEDDRYILLPGKLYENEPEARLVLAGYFTEDGVYDEGYFKIMAL